MDTQTVFAVGDRVRCEEKKRYNGTVLFVVCGECSFCSSRTYGNCTGSVKNCIVASFSIDENTSNTKRFKYKPSELALEPPLPPKAEYKTIDLCSKDIRPLDTLTIELPDMETEESFGQAEELTQVHSVQTPFLRSDKPITSYRTVDPDMSPIVGLFFDRFLELGGEMLRPV